MTLFYDLTPQGEHLGMVLSDYEEFVGKYKCTIKGKWILDPGAVGKVIEFGYIQHIKGIWSAWLDLVRQAAFVNQDGRSLLSGERLDIFTMQLHHALFPKNMVQGIRGTQKNLIHHSYNVMLLSPEEHLDGAEAHDRELCAEKLVGLYGSAVRLWYFTAIKFRSTIPNIFNDQ